MLLDPIRLGRLELPNRVVMAPLTRLRSTMPGNIPNALMARYYAQRAGAGLLIAEATPVSPTAGGYYGAPHVHTDVQEDGWRGVTDAVHEAGGRIFLQLWHVGRVSHPDLQPGGALPVAPSEGSAGGEAPVAPGVTKPRVAARALEAEEIPGIVADFARAAERAIRAGFDGVEVHGANSYLLEQFLSDGANRRTDAYGGSVAARSRFAFEVVAAVAQAVGPERTGIRLSPSNTGGGITHSDRHAQYADLLGRLDPLGLAYVHIVEPRSDEELAEPLSTERLRPLITGDTRVISAGGHTPESGEAVLASGDADLVAYGRLYISNPDLPERFRIGADLAPYDRATFYGGDGRGYTDYPNSTDDPALAEVR